MSDQIYFSLFPVGAPANKPSEHLPIAPRNAPCIQSATLTLLCNLPQCISELADTYIWSNRTMFRIWTRQQVHAGMCSGMM